MGVRNKPAEMHGLKTAENFYNLFFKQIKDQQQCCKRNKNLSLEHLRVYDPVTVSIHSPGRTGRVKE